MDWERFYAVLPIPLQEAAVSIEGWRIRRQRYNRVFHRLLAEHRARETWTQEAIVAWRDRRLTVGQLRQSRDAFAHAFGSCSIDEPLADLRALRLLAPSSAKHS